MRGATKPPPETAARAGYARAMSLMLACQILGAACTAGLGEPTPAEPVAPEEVPLPLACAGADRQALRATTVALDARCSRSLDAGEALSVVWRQISGGRVTLQSAVSEQVSFLAPFSTGRLEFTLEAQLDALSGTDRAGVEVVERTTAAAPLAVAGGDQYVDDGQVLLDGQRSSEVMGQIVAYRWRQVSGPNAVIADPTAPATAVTLAPEAAAAFALEVQEASGLWSEPELVIARPPDTTRPLPPPRSITTPAYVLPGDAVELGTSTRLDQEGARSSFRQLRGEPLVLDLSDPRRVRFVAPRTPQVLAFRLDHDDHGVRAAPAVAVITVTAGIGNLPPVADAGPDRTVRPGQRLSLGADGSYDPDGDPLVFFSWAQTAGPTLGLSCQDDTCVIDAPDAQTRFAIALVVGDGVATSPPDVVVVEVDPSASNQPPTADAGGERWVQPEASTVLDGSGSDDPDSGTIASYRWRQLEDGAPRALIGDAALPALEVTAPQAPADLTFELTVCDPDQACGSDLAVLHVAPAGPYVDGQLGSDGGDGTVAAPLRTVAQGLAQATRYGFSELYIAAGRYLESAPLFIPSELRVMGGVVRQGNAYVAAPDQATEIAVPGVDAITLDTGAALEQLTVETAAAAATIPRRRLIVMGTRTRLSRVDVVGPSHAEQTIGVDLLEGGRAELLSVVVRGGSAAAETVGIRANPTTLLQANGVAVAIGAAPRAIGITAAHGQLELVDTHVVSDGGRAEQQIGMELVWAQVGATASSVHLDAAPAAAPLRDAVGVRCHKCSLSLDASCEVVGARGLGAASTSTGVKLYLAPAAFVAGLVAGGADSPGARLIGLDIFGGAAEIRQAVVRATLDEVAESAVGIAVDSAELALLDTRVEALAGEVAIGLQLSAAPAPLLALTELTVRARRAYGVVDGMAPLLGADGSPSSEIQLELQGPARISGTDEAWGVALRGSTDAILAARDLLAAADATACALSLEEATGVAVLSSRLLAQVTGETGAAAAVRCTATAAAGEAALSGTRLLASGSTAVALDAGACTVSASAAVLLARGALEAYAARADGGLALNGVYAAAHAAAGTAVALGANGSGEVYNCIVDVPTPALAALRAETSVDQWLALHHLVLSPLEVPRLSVGDDVVATSAADLASLRPRFTDLIESDDPAIDEEGHLTGASSPALDRADPLSATAVDIDGDPRPRGAGPDIGPDEY